MFSAFFGWFFKLTKSPFSWDFSKCGVGHIYETWPFLILRRGVDLKGSHVVVLQVLGEKIVEKRTHFVPKCPMTRKIGTVRVLHFFLRNRQDEELPELGAALNGGKAQSLVNILRVGLGLFPSDSLESQSYDFHLKVGRKKALLQK